MTFDGHNLVCKPGTRNVQTIGGEVQVQDEYVYSFRLEKIAHSG